MATVAMGARLVLRTAQGPVPIRALREVVLTGSWVVPVMAPLRALQSGGGVLEIATDTGLFRAPAHFRVGAGALELRPGSAELPALLQRRDEVRGRATLPLRAVAADAAAERALGESIIEGATIDVSAGGLSIELHPRSIPPRRGSRLYLELTLPGGDLVPAVACIVAAGDRRLHLRFADIAAADTERLARLVFRLQRPELAARSRLLQDGQS
jgi:hypothetical protein